MVDINGTSKLVSSVKRTGAEASQQEQNHSLACSHNHRDVWDGNLQIEDHDTRSICVLYDHTFVAIDREDCNRATYGRAPTRELLLNVDQIIHLMAKFEPAQVSASVGDPIHR